MTQWIYVMLAGAVGSAARYACSTVCLRWSGTGWPLGTMFVNLLGCFLIGLFVTVFQNKSGISKELQIALIAGFLGAFTTFSTLIFETVELTKQGQQILALGYVLLSVAAGFLIFQLGVVVAELF